MKMKLPFRLQAMAFIFVCDVWLAAMGWVYWQKTIPPSGLPDYRWEARVEDATNGMVYLAMPLPILYLGTRLLWRFADVKNRRHLVDVAIACIVVLFLLPALIAIAFGLLPPGQKVREAGLTQGNVPTAGVNR